MNVYGCWENLVDDVLCIGWVCDFFKVLVLFVSGGVYVNFLIVDESDCICVVYGLNYDCFVYVKCWYDLDNFFWVN